MKRFLPLGALATILALAGCGGSQSVPPAASPLVSSGTSRIVLDTIGGSPPMRLLLRLFDAPLANGKNAKVNLALLGANVVAHGQASPFVTYDQPQTVDLLTLQQTPLSLDGTLPAGRYDGVRLLVDAALSNVTVDGHVYPMLFTGNQHTQRGGVVALDAAVPISGASGDSLNIALDFNVFESISIRGNYAYVKPKLVVADRAAQVVGRVATAAGTPVQNATVIAYDRKGEIANSTLTAADGSFMLHALRAGDYRITVMNTYVTDSGESVVAIGATSLTGPSVNVVLPPSGMLDVGTLND